jgi:hypothetical protein
MREISHSNRAGEQVAEHVEFRRLCTLFSAGALTVQESSRLDEHLAWCSDCRRYMEQSPRKAGAAMAALAPRIAPGTVSAHSFDSEVAKRQLLEMLPHANERQPDRSAGVLSRALVSMGTFRPFLAYAAGFLIATGLSLAIYWNGPRRQADESRLSADRAEKDAAASREEAAKFSKQLEALNTTLQERASAVLALQSQLVQMQSRINELQSSGTKTAEEERQVQAAKEVLAKDFQDAQAQIAALRSELETSRQQQDSESAIAADKAKGIDQLSAQLRDEEDKIGHLEATIQEQRELLASDRDIRDLIGARQLYVAEVYDSDPNGRPKKAYARVFFTKDKSLIFYGFDLDRQPGVKDANAFQVWGRRGANRENALNLGILFQDSSTNKRWILKINDPIKLQQIDAVFVTIEPKGGSAQPTGKPLLFAYLRVDPNHP